MKRKAIALLLSLTMLSLSTTAYAADTVQNAPTINSSGKVVIGNTDITIDSKDLSTGVITTYVGTGHHYYRRVVVYYLD